MAKETTGRNNGDRNEIVGGQFAAGSPSLGTEHAVGNGASLANSRNSSREMESEDVLDAEVGGDKADSTNQNEERQNEIYRGNLLLLAQFLNYYQPFYSYSSDEESELGSIITPQDIEDAMNYRFLLQIRAELFDQKCNQEAEQLITATGDGDIATEEEDEETGEIDPLRRQRLENTLLDVEDKLAEHPKRIRQIHSLLQRFEVWSTKELAHTLLMPDCGCKSLNEATNKCWSKLLHVPGAAYFIDRWPEPLMNGLLDSDKENDDVDQSQGQEKQHPQQGREANKAENKFRTEFAKLYHHAHARQAGHSMCSLVLPPNYYTWEEYLRIASMVSCLPTALARNAAADSPCNGVLRTIHQSTRPNEPLPAKDKTIYASDFVFEAHDKVGLWLRAQRSTVGLRHLIQLYSWLPRKQMVTDVSKQGGKKGRSKTDVSVPPKPNRGDFNDYEVLFCGNHKSTKRRVLGESKLVDSLVEWAVMNQVLITYHFMHKQLGKKEQTKNKAKKSPFQAAGIVNGTPSKRRRTSIANGSRSETPAAANYDRDLLRSCYCYILRWFARRNQLVVAILYVSQQELFPSPAAPLYYTEEAFGFLKKCCKTDIRDAIDQKFKCFKGADSSSRSFARIDRRIRRGKLDPADCDIDYKDCPFYVAVSRLLEIWKECLLETESIEIEPGVLTAVQEDFRSLFHEFSRVKVDFGLIAAARKLLGDSTHELDPDDLANRLLSFQSPWNDVCSICSEGSRQHPVETRVKFKVCSCCERAFNDQCYHASNFYSVGMVELLKDKKDLQLQLFPVEPSATGLQPDFRGSNARKIQWETITLTITRKIFDGGKLQSFGLKLRQTEASTKFLDQLTRGQVSIHDLYNLKIEDNFPVALEADMNGCLVAGIKDAENSAGRNAGIKVNDVIVQVQLLSFVGGAGPDGANEPQDLGNLSKESRLQLFQLPATKVKVMLKRPSINLLKQCSAWIDGLRERNKPLKALYEQRISICKDCQQNRNDAKEIHGIRREALYCRAIIRKLGMESYSVRFHDEELLVGTQRGDIGGYGSDSRFVSLSRLDAMMDHIIVSHSDERFMKQDSNPESYRKLLHNAFYTPPWSSSGRSRLLWAPPDLESKPAELLCCGIRVLLRAENEGVNDVIDFNVQQDKRALLRHFLQLFGSWYLLATQNLSQGPPVWALNNRPPWIKPCCAACHVRYATDEYSWLKICESRLCRRLLEAPLAQSSRLKDEGDKLALYEENAKSIGSSILIFPGDPLLDDVAHKIGWKEIVHFGRPVEFLCACFVPPLSRVDNGEFFLLPVIQESQLQFLLDRCTLLDPPAELSAETVAHWIQSSILGLQGVLRLSPKDLDNKRNETYSYLEKIRADIAKNALGGNTEFPSGPVYQIQPICERAPVSASLRAPPHTFVGSPLSEFLHRCAKRCSWLLDCMVRIPSPVVQSMVGATEDFRGDDMDAFEALDNGMEDYELGPGTSSSPSHTKQAVDTDEDWPSKMLAKPVGSTLTSLNFDVPRQQGHTLDVYYTDLYFTTLDQKSRLQKSLHQQKLISPVGRKRDETCDCRKTVALSRSGGVLSACVRDYPEYTGSGWGFEICKWRGDKHLRVGRVHPNSPAAMSGLQSDDILVSINGRALSGPQWTVAFLTSAILASPLPSKSWHNCKALDTIAAVLTRTGSKGAVRGPVVFSLDRPKYDDILASSNAHHGNLTGNKAPGADNAWREDARADVLPNDRAHKIFAVNGHTARVSNNVDEPENGQHQNPQVHHAHAPQPRLSINSIGQQRQEPAARPGGQQQQRVGLGPAGQLASVEVQLYEAVRVLASAVSIVTPRRDLVESRDLYVAVGLCTVFTRIEAAVYLEALRDNIPMLGLRLLCPRYNLQTVVQQVLNLASAKEHLDKVPRLSVEMWKEVLRIDYKRHENESDQLPKTFTDKSGSYPFPTELLPLDRLVEQFMRRRVAAQRSELDEPQTGAQHNEETGQRQRPTVPQHVMAHPTTIGQPIRQSAHSNSNQALNRAHLPRQNIRYPAGQGGENDPVGRFSHAQVDPNDPEARIRGGGDNDEKESLPDDSLVSLPVASWENQLVYMDSETTEFGESRGHHTFIGYVWKLPDELLAKTSKEIMDMEDVEIQVALIYSDQLGVFSEASIQDVDPFDLRIVQTNSAYSKTAKQIMEKFDPLKKLADSKRFREGVSGCEGEASGIEGEPGTRTSRPSLDKVSAAALLSDGSQHSTNRANAQRSAILQRTMAMDDNSKEVLAASEANVVDDSFGQNIANFATVAAFGNRVEKESKVFIRDVCKQLRGALKPLGYLPDGEAILWLVSDPEALYIQVIENASIASTFSEQNVYHCAWGCTFECSGENVQFDSETQLKRHNKCFHSFGLERAKDFSFGALQRFSRLPATDNAMKELIEGLTSAVCAHSSYLADQVAKKSPAISKADPSGKQIICSPRPQHLTLNSAQVLEMARNYESWSKIPLNDLSRKVDRSSQFLYLLSRIMLLFNTDGDFTCRLNNSELNRLCTIWDAGQSNTLTWQTLCGVELESGKGGKRGRQNMCALCALDSEEVLQAEHDNGMQGIGPHGIGCATAGSMHFLQKEELDIPTITQADLGFIKKSLIRIWKNIPTALRHVEEENGKDRLGIIRNLVWTKGSSAYRKYIYRSTSISMLAQAFVVLLGSIKRKKLPLWWREDEMGWCKAQRLVLFPSKASLALHLMLFDVALTEFVETEPELHAPFGTLTFPSQDLVPSNFLSMSPDERMTELIRSAQQASVPRYQDKHMSYCCVCDDGGELLCCEFCSRVVHKYCCNPPLDKFPNSWCCAACTVDILELAKS